MGFTTVSANENGSETTGQQSGQNQREAQKTSSLNAQTSKQQNTTNNNRSSPAAHQVVSIDNNNAPSLNEDVNNSSADSAKAPNDTVIPQNQSEEQRNSMSEKNDEPKEEVVDWYSVASLLLSLLIIGYLYKLRKDSKRGNSNNQGKEGENDLPPGYTKKQLKKIDGDIYAIQVKINNLEVKISQLERISQRNEQHYTNSQSNSNITNNKTVSVNTRLYASMIKNDVFPRMGISENIQTGTIFIMTVYGDGGTFVINDAESAQQTILSNFAYTVANAVNIKSKNSAPKRIITIKPGKITKSPDGWKIISKAEIELM